ncbi:hypothetical protein ACYZT8_07515 [Pseudomonas sp. LB3P93]
MTAYKRFTDDDPGRAAMKAARLARSTRVAKPPELQGLLPPVVGDDPNKLPKALQGGDNDVTIEEVLVLDPPAPDGRQVQLQLLWKGVPVGVPLMARTPITTTQTLVLPGSATISEGVFPLSYRLIYAGLPYDYESPVSIYIDKEAPNKNVAGAEVELPAEYADLRITKERLEIDPVIALTIPLHSDRRTGDLVDVFMGASEPGTYIDTYEAPDDSDSVMTVDLTKAQVENGREGKRIIYYKWRDRVGNEGPSSHELEVTVELTAAPGNLKPLEVPEAPDPDNLITIRDAFPDVGVLIKAYDNIGPMDEVALIWDGIAQARKRSVDGFPMIFDVPYEHVKRNGLGPRPVTVTYSVWRGDQQYEETTAVPVNVDLRRPGTPPPDPEDPDIGNPNLAPVTVQAANTTDPNKFELIDAGEDGTASTVIDDVRNDGDIYQLYWKNIAVPAPGGQYVVDGTESDGDPITFSILGAFITARGNGPEIPVHYTITNPSLPDENPNPSLRQPVSVYVIDVTLPEPKINYLSTVGGDEYLNCFSLRNISNVGWAAVVDVRGGAPLESGMELEFIWEGTTYDGTGPIPLPDYKFPKTLSGNEHIDGFTVYLPYEGALKPIKDGDGKIRYEVTIDSRLEASDKHEVAVVVRDGAGGECPLP